MHKKGDILKMIDPCLSLRQDVQEWKDSTGRTHWVYWNETRKLYVGRQCEVEKVDGDFLHVNFYVPNEFDPWETFKVTFLMHQEWFVNPIVEPPKCTCHIMVLMSSGCRCGQMKREKGNA